MSRSGNTVDQFAAYFDSEEAFKNFKNDPTAFLRAKGCGLSGPSQEIMAASTGAL